MLHSEENKVSFINIFLYCVKGCQRLANPLDILSFGDYECYKIRIELRKKVPRESELNKITYHHWQYDYVLVMEFHKNRELSSLLDHKETKY